MAKKPHLQLLEHPTIRLARRLHETVDNVVANALPGDVEYVAAHPDVVQWIDKQRERVDRALRDVDEVLFSDAIGAWTKAWERVNELVAEEYAAKVTAPADWELRYLKWMKVRWVLFETRFGDIYLFPRRPRRPPPLGTRWVTVDEMLGWIENPGAIQAVIEAFEVLPARAEELPALARGEQDLVVDFTGETSVIRCRMGGIRDGT